MKSKKITKFGGMTIPADIRRSANLLPGDAVDIDLQSGKIIITAHIPRCFICDSEHDVWNYQGKKICEACIKAMGGMINEC